MPWTLPTPLSRSVVVSTGESGVVAGGLSTGNITTDKVYRVSASGVGARLPSLAEPVHDGAGAALDGRTVVVGGGNTHELSTVESARPGQRWKATGHLPDTRSDLSALATRRGLLVVGGYDGVSSPRSVLISVDGRSFTTLTRLRHGVRYAAVLLVGHSVWVFGGEDAGRELRSTQVIDLVTGKVRTSRSLPTRLGHAAVTLVGSRILLMGGRTAPHQITRTMWWCDPATGRFTRAGRLPYPVADSGVLQTRNATYLLGGESPDFTKRVTRVAWR
jgi:N-acetylneuraminic acid mutarotase